MNTTSVRVELDTERGGMPHRDVYVGDTHVGVVMDEQLADGTSLPRGRWATWTSRTGTVTFHADLDDAVAAIVSTHTGVTDNNNQESTMSLTFEALPTGRSLATIPTDFIVDNIAAVTLIALARDIDDINALGHDDVTSIVTGALRLHGESALIRERPANFADRVARAAALVRRLFPALDDEALALFEHRTAN